MMSKTPQGASHREISEWNGQVRVIENDLLAEETPVALIYNGISHAVMMASPIDLEAFAYGFSLTEGIIDDPAQIYGIDVCPVELGIEVMITLSNRQFEHLKKRRRTLVGPSGCGLCGAESLTQVQQNISALTRQKFQVSHDAIQSATDQLSHHQPLQQSTGAVHGAAWCTLGGQIIDVCEDVGRHNALDKLIGKRAAQENSDQELGFLLMSSRASFEIVQKAAMTSIALVVTISGPSSLAVDLAVESGITLVGFSRPDRHVVYTHPHRVVEGDDLQDFLIDSPSRQNSHR